MCIPLPLAFTWPIRLEYFSGWVAALAFALLALPIVFFGIRSLSGLGPVRKWVAIGLRLAVLLVMILILGGIRWQRQHKDVEVQAIVDVSRSVEVNYRGFPRSSYIESVDSYLQSFAKDPSKRAGDRWGKITFQNWASIDALPSTSLRLDARPIPKRGSGTDAATAIQLALATASKDAMHRFVLFWDGNNTAGDMEAAVAAAASAGVPIDVVPLQYDVQNEVMLDRFIAPSWKRENEPFTIDVILKSTNVLPVTGNLTVTHQGQPLDLDPETPGVQSARRVTLNNGSNRQSVRVPPLGEAGVHQFRAVFDAEGVTTEVGGQKVAGGDTIPENNAGDVFTFVRGKGKVLYIDNVVDRNDSNPGKILADALAKEGIAFETRTVDGFPRNAVEMQNYDAVILANVPRGGEGALSIEHDKNLRSYVQNMGGGLIMIGGENTFGAGGWQGSEVEKALPVEMDIPAQRQVGKGALALIVHSCEFPDGNYWGEQCAIKAVETLGEKDDIGVITFGWQGGGSIWDYPLKEKGDGTAVFQAIKKMQVGDMPDFDNSMNLALNGSNGVGGLIRSNARHKHVIIISDGDPQAPKPGLVQQYKAAKVTVSTVSVYPHMGGAGAQGTLPPTMAAIARDLGGKAYGPINGNFAQLPQIFIKEATLVRRSLIHEDAGGIPVNVLDASDDIIKGFDAFPPINGLVLTTRKNDPRVQMPLAVGKNNDPVLAWWQTGLGKAVVFPSDAHNKWAPQWVGWDGYAKFWAQVVRKVARPPMSSDFDVQTTITGDKGKIVVEALGNEGEAQNFLSIAGTVVGPDMKEKKVRLVQTGPGIYEGEFDTDEPGNYVAAMSYRGRDNQSGILLSGAAMNSSPEMRDLRSNEANIQMVVDRTGGRRLDPFTIPPAGMFTREGLRQTASPLPVWDVLLPFLLGLILLDVAVRRIAWDWESTKRLGAAMAARVRAFTVTTRKVEGRETLDALKKVRGEVAETKFRTGDAGAAVASGAGSAKPQAAAARPDPKAKFEAKGVEGDISKVVGGATDKPIPAAPKKIEPKGAVGGTGDHVGGLMAAKRRAQQQIKEKETGEG